MITVLNILGIPDDDKLRIVHNLGDPKEFIYGVDGNSNIVTNRALNGIKIVNLFLGGENQNINLDLADDVIIFNSISNADSSKKALSYLENLTIQSKLPVINNAEFVLKTSREQNYKNLKDLDDKIILPRCERIKPNSINKVKEYIQSNNIKLPIIFRTTSDHGSENMIKLDKIDDFYQLEQFAFNGKNEFYIIEFHNYKSKNGLYKKARFWIIGDRVITRHLVISDDWNISYDKRTLLMKNNKNLQKEEKKFISKAEPSIIEKCLKIKKAMNLDYLGIDCNIDNEGNMLIFEVTPAMGIMIDNDFPYLNTKIDESMKALKELITDKSIK